MKHAVLYCYGKWFNAVAGYSFQTAKILRDRNIRITCIVKPHSPLEKKLNDESIDQFQFFSKNPFATAYGIIQFARFVKRNQIRNAIVFTSNGIVLFAFLRFFIPELNVIRFRGDASPPSMNRLSRWSYSKKCIDGMVFPSAYAKALHRELLDRSMPSTIIPYALRKNDVGNIPPANRDKVLRRCGIPADRTVFCLLGRNQPVKGHIDLIRAFKLADMPHAHLLFLIKDLDEFPEELARIKNELDTLHIRHRVTVLGHVTSLDDFLSATDCGVVSSLGSEAICRVAVEFFSRSVPVIAYPVGSLPEMIQHKKNGFLCSKSTVADLAAQLVAFDRLSPESVSTMRSNTVNIFRQTYTERVFFDRLSLLMRKNG